jgi:hypothetical protein
LKRQKKKGPKVLVNFVKLAKIAISPVLGQSLAEFEVGSAQYKFESQHVTERDVTAVNCQ